MEMHQLRYLEAVARCGSMMAAAANCHVSQPALSVQIRKLEDEVGAPLLVRGARGVTLTSAGARTLVTARRILREVEQLRTDARRRDFRARPVVRIAVQPYLATELLPPLLAEQPRTKETPQMQLRERPPARVVESVASGGSDLGLLDLEAVPLGDLATEELARLPYACFCPADHPLAAKRAVRLAHLLECRLLLFEQSPGLLRRLTSLARERERELQIPLSSEMAVTLFEFVARGAGVAVLPVSFAARAKRRRVVMRPLADYDGRVAIGAVWRPAGSAPAPALPIMESLRAYLTSWQRFV